MNRLSVNKQSQIVSALVEGNRIQLTTDGHRVYADDVEDAFGADIDYAMLVKLYPTCPPCLQKGGEIFFPALRQNAL